MSISKFPFKEQKETLDVFSPETMKNISKELVLNFVDANFAVQIANKVDYPRRQKNIESQSTLDKEIKELYVAIEKAYNSGNHTQFGLFTMALASSYKTADIVRVLGISTVCYMFLWQAQDYLEHSDLKGVKNALNSINPYIKDLADDSTFIYHFSCVKSEYWLRTKQYENVLGLRNNGIYVDPRKLPEVDVQIIITEMKLSALLGLKQYEKAASLLKEMFSHFSDLPDTMKKLLDWQATILIQQCATPYKEKNYAEVESLVREFLDRQPNNQKAKDMLSSLLTELSDKNDVENLLLKGKILFDLKKYDKAQEMFEGVIGLDQNNQEAIDYLFYKLPVPQKITHT